VIVVADAGPVLHLHWIGCLSWGLPPARIHVVEQVWTEIAQHAPQALADPRLEREPVVEIDPALQAKFSLQAGETAAIAFALKHPASLLLTDDAAARRACASVGLAAVGTIGLILEAARSKRVPVDEALQALERLPNKGRLHVAPELLARAIAALLTTT
jgi:predicted nucleic acid-binding protein